MGYTDEEKAPLERQQVVCYKGGEDAPKIFNRFTTVDAPERQLSYIADEEAYDAISFFPLKEIKFAGFSVYHVASNTEMDFKCLYKIRIGTDIFPEQAIDFKQSDVENKMVDIMMDKEITVPKDKEISIAVRFTQGDEFFCSTLLGYGGENLKHNHLNEELAFDVRESPECTKGETDVAFGQVPRLHYFSK